MGIMQCVADGQSAAGVSWVLCCRHAMGSVQSVYDGQWLMGSAVAVPATLSEYCLGPTALTAADQYGDVG